MSQAQTIGNQQEFSREVARILPLIMKEFARSQHANILSRIPLTMSQILVLEFLAEKTSCKMSELAQTLNFTMSAVTAIIDKMIKLKLVKRQRSTEDRRVVNVAMLNKGRKMISAVRQARCHCVSELFTALNEQDKSEYIRILRKVYDNLKQKQ